MSDKPQEPLNDAMQAQVVSPVWHIRPNPKSLVASLTPLQKETEVPSFVLMGIMVPSGLLFHNSVMPAQEGI
ncbi:hypothetical protein ACFXTO_015877 [Malus domestica]